MSTHRPSASNDRGFTLVELLIVIVVLGVLAAITVFAVRGITNEGVTSACDSDRKQVQTAEEASMAQSGAYVSEDQLVTAGFLHEASPNVDVSVNGADYTVTDTGQCAGAATTTTAAAATTSTSTTTTTTVAPSGPVAGTYAGLTSWTLGSGPTVIVVAGFGPMGAQDAQDTFDAVVAHGVATGYKVVYVDCRSASPAFSAIAAISPNYILWTYGGDFGTNGWAADQMRAYVPATYDMSMPGSAIAYMTGNGWINP